MELAQDSVVNGVEFFGASSLESRLKDVRIIYCSTSVEETVY